MEFFVIGYKIVSRSIHIALQIIKMAAILKRVRDSAH